MRQELYEDGGSDRHRANAYQLRGLIFATLGKEAEAIQDFDEQIKLQPDRVEALGKRGYSVALPPESLRLR